MVWCAGKSTGAGEDLESIDWDAPLSMARSHAGEHLEMHKCFTHAIYHFRCKASGPPSAAIIAADTPTAKARLCCCSET